MNPSERLFIGTVPTGLVYCDRGREVAGDYLRVARLDFATLELEMCAGMPQEMRREIERHAAQVQARKGERYEISACGQSVVLGGGR